MRVFQLKDLGENRLQSEVGTKHTNQVIKDSGWRFDKVTSMSN